MVEDRTCQDDAVDHRNRDADVCPLGKRTQHSARGRAVKVEKVARTSVNAWDHEWPALVNKADVAVKRLVEDGVDHRPVVVTTFGMASNRGLGARRLGHISI